MAITLEEVYLVIERLRAESQMLVQENEQLKEKIKELEKQNASK